MAQAFPNSVRFLVTNPGTSTFTVGSTPAGFFPLTDVTDADTVYYSASDKDGGREEGYGTVGGTGTTLTRTVVRSTNANAAVNFTGVTDVAIIVLGDFFKARSRSCAVHQSATTSLSTTWTSLEFGTSEYDTGGFYDPTDATSRSRLTVPVTGKYLFGMSVFTSSNAVIGARLNLNGSSVIAQQRQGNSGADEAATVSRLYSLSASDYILFQAYAGSSVSSSGDILTNAWIMQVA